MFVDFFRIKRRMGVGAATDVDPKNCLTLLWARQNSMGVGGDAQSDPNELCWGSLDVQQGEYQQEQCHGTRKQPPTCSDP